MPQKQSSPAPDFIPADSTPDFIPADGGEVLPPAPKQPPGLLENLGRSLGLPTNKQELQQGAEDAYQHPIRSAIESDPGVSILKSLYGGAKRIGGELLQAGEDARSGNAAGTAVHAAQAIPFIGAGLKQSVDELPAKQGPYDLSDVTGGMAGTAIGTAAQVAPIALGAADAAFPLRRLTAPLSTARSGVTLGRIRAQLENEPVTLTRSLPDLERAQQLSDAGHGTVTPLDSLYRRVNTVNPLGFGEARDRYSALSNLTGEDKLKTTPSLRRQTKIFNSGFGKDIADTAEANGVGPEFNHAMSEYRRAMTLRDYLKTGAKYALPAAGVGVAGKVAKDLLAR